MQKRRHYSSSLKYSHTHERFLGKTRNIHDSKGRNSKRSYTKLQQKNNNCNDAPYLRKDTFHFLESLFDLKKILNLKDVYSLAFNYHKEKSIETLNIIKSEPFVETLFLQSSSPQTNLELLEPLVCFYILRSFFLHFINEKQWKKNKLFLIESTINIRISFQFDKCSKKNKEKTRNKIKTSKVFETKILDSVQELQKNDLTHNQQNLSK